MKITRIVCQRCLECWLASDPQAIIDAVRGKHGVDLQLTPQTTDNLTPNQAKERIAHIINQTGQKLDRWDLQQIRASNIKSRGKTIAEHISLTQAGRYNGSLKYFFEMLPCVQSGCEHPFPERS